MTTPTRREKCDHDILKCGGCGEFVAMMTRAEERLIKAALRMEKLWMRGECASGIEFDRAADAVARERERDAKKGKP